MTNGRCALCDAPIVWAVWKRSLVRASFDKEPAVGGRVELVASGLGGTIAQLVPPNGRPLYSPHSCVFTKGER